MADDVQEDMEGTEGRRQKLQDALDDAWQNAVDPHDLNGGLLSGDQPLDSGKTIVPANVLPQGALEVAKVAPPEDSGVEVARTVHDQIPSHPASRVGEKDDEEIGKKTIGKSILPMRTAVTAAFVKETQEYATRVGPEVTVHEKVLVDAESEEPSLRSRPEADYELRGLLGEGGMGTVYKARQTSIDREIALKLINPDLAQDKEVQANLLAEAAVTGELEHPNIVPVYEMGIQEGGLLFYTMKKTKGESWDTVLEKLSEEENIEVLMKACDAVAYAHSKGIIHRDLKPENITLGDYGEVLVMDWGLAASVVDGGKIEKISEANAFGGTPGYMAPEMALGDTELLGTKSDVYLLGGILYEILTGNRPHAGAKARELMSNIAMNEIVETDRDDELVGIAMKAMEMDPDDRYETVQDFQKAVREALRHSESFALARKANAGLAKAVKDKEYEGFSQALFGFQEALTMWEGNDEAREGVRETRVAYASAALEKGDLDLASSLIALIQPPPKEQQQELDRLRAEQKARASRFKALKYASVSLVAIIIIGLTVSYVIVEGKRKEAVEARAEAQKQRVRAEEGEKEAVAAKEEVQKAKDDLEKQHELTLAANKEAIAQRKVALEAKDEAEGERKKALVAKDEAVKQRAAAVKSEAEAQRQKKVAVKAKDEAVKAKDEAETQRRNAETQREIAQKQRKIAEDSLRKLQRIGELKSRIKRSLTPEEANAAQAKSAQQSSLEAFKTIALNGTQMELALIPEGEFVMGSDITEDERVGEEYLHEVKFTKPFYMSRKEVTQSQWLAVTGQPNRKAYNPSTDADLPVTNVSFNQFTEIFLPKLNGAAPKGFLFRMPTEAEWEYACRAGNYAAFQSGTAENLGEFAWYRSNSGKKTHAVGGKKPNAWGLYDMHGNVTEMCVDYYARNFYLTAKTENPVNEAVSDYRVARGGSWISLPQHCRSAYRSFIYPDNQYKYMGFRLVMVANGQK